MSLGGTIENQQLLLEDHGSGYQRTRAARIGEPGHRRWGRQRPVDEIGMAHS
jgi:hypothetical protein